MNRSYSSHLFFQHLTSFPFILTQRTFWPNKLLSPMFWQLFRHHTSACSTKPTRRVPKTCWRTSIFLLQMVAHRTPFSWRIVQAIQVPRSFCCRIRRNSWRSQLSVPKAQGGSCREGSEDAIATDLSLEEWWIDFFCPYIACSGISWSTGTMVSSTGWMVSSHFFLWPILLIQIKMSL